MRLRLIGPLALIGATAVVILTTYHPHQAPRGMYTQRFNFGQWTATVDKETGDTTTWTRHGRRFRNVTAFNLLTGVPYRPRQLSLHDGDPAYRLIAPKGLYRIAGDGETLMDSVRFWNSPIAAPK
jgi:hypothetical protein